MKINGKTRVCGLIGYPVEHTLSPVIHNHLADMLNINLVYVPLPVENKEVAKAVQGAKIMNFLGMNVTVPYKSKVMACLTEIDEVAEKIGAVNTLVAVENGYKGYNTDMPGLLRAMKSQGVSLKDREVVILGAGGVARAVAVLCGKEHAKKIYLMNRNQETAKEVAEEIKDYYPEIEVQVLMYQEYDQLPEDSLIAVQCTTVGLYPNEDEVIIETPEFYKRVQIGYDLIFNPFTTKFMKLVQSHGGKAYNGLKMLLYQGIISFELWNRVEVTEEMAEFIYEKMKVELEIHE